MNIDQAMQLAIDEALKGGPFVSPNPKVGCVVLNQNGSLISKGFHTRYGAPHAEVEALKSLKQDQVRGAHVVVTLEPCAHEGKTPSCAQMLAKLPISKVTFGLVDPNPLVSGQGAQILKQAGIEVEEYQGALKDNLEETCEEFLWNFREKKVFVALKIAQSLDGKIALQSGESKWITGPESREKVHQLRACYDAILVGKNTILRDDPSLDVRHPEIQKENKVIILDRSGVIESRKSHLQVFKTHRPENVLVLKSQSISEALEVAYSSGIRSLLVEGGGQIFSQFLSQKLFQRLHLFTAPVVLGQGLSWSEGLKLNQMQEKLELQQIRTQGFGKDSYLTGKPS